MRALVSGGTGFVGANLVAALTESGVQVRVLHRPTSSLTALAGLSYETAIGDVLDDTAMLAEAMSGCDWVFHTAAIADYWRYRTRRRLYETNVDGTRNMASAALRAGVSRFVYTSSIAALGIPEPGRLLTEDDQFTLAPRRFPYGHSKYLAELAVQEMVTAGLPAVIVNPSVVIGPRDVNRIASAMVVEAAAGRLQFAAPGGTNFVATTDVVAGHIAAAERGRVGRRYILAGENLGFAEAFGTVCALVGRPAPRIMLPRWVIPVAAGAVAAARTVVGPRLPIDAKQMRLSAYQIYADGTRARTELGVPFTTFATAIETAYRWYVDNGYVQERSAGTH